MGGDRVSAIVPADGGAVSFAYADGALASVSVDGSVWRSFAYDGNGDLTEVRDPAGRLLHAWSHCGGAARDALTACVVALLPHHRANQIENAGRNGPLWSGIGASATSPLTAGRNLERRTALIPALGWRGRPTGFHAHRGPGSTKGGVP